MLPWQASLAIAASTAIKWLRAECLMPQAFMRGVLINQHQRTTGGIAAEKIGKAIAQDTAVKIAAQHGFNAGKPIIAIRMDNVFAERLWRSVKYKKVHLRAHDSVSDAGASLGWYLAFYNYRRPRSSQGVRTPEQAYHQ